MEQPRDDFSIKMPGVVTNETKLGNGRDASFPMTWEQAVAWARETPTMAGLVQVCYYDDPIDLAAARFIASEEWPAIQSFLPPAPGRRVLEIGAGRGIVSWAFADAGCEVDAVEPDASDLVGAGAIRRLCEATGRDVRISGLAGECLPFADATFDYALCRGVLHHVADLPQVCREVFRVLKPGGRFLAIKEHVADTPDELSAFLAAHPLQHLYGGEHAFPLKSYLSALREAGFRSIRDIGPFKHPVSSAPAITTEQLRGMLVRAVAKRSSLSFGKRVARRNVALRLWRAWLGARTRTPGRMHSFVADKSR